MQHNEADEDHTRKQIFVCKFKTLVAKLTTLVPTHIHTSTLAHTQAHTVAPITQTNTTAYTTSAYTTSAYTTPAYTTPAYTAAAVTLQVNEIVRSLQEQNKLLRNRWPNYPDAVSNWNHR